MITVNGKPEELEGSATVKEYLERKQYRTDRVAVEKKRGDRSEKQL